MKKKALATLLALSMVAGCFAGCGNSEKEGSSSGDKAETEAEQNSGEEEETEEDSNFNETGYPIVDEKVTFTFWAPTSIADPNEAEIYQQLEELTNVHIEWQTVPEDSAVERINLAFTGGEYPDAITASNVISGNIQQYISAGQIIALNDLIDKYMPNFKSFMEGTDVSTLIYPDGNLYEFPYVDDYYYMDQFLGVYINQEWLDNVGMEMPTTTEEFKEVLRAFKEQDANGNGDPTDEIPFSANATGYQTMFSMLTGAFGYPLGGLTVADDGETVIDPRMDEGLKDAIKYIRELYTEGLIDPEIFTQDSSAQLAKTKMDPVIVGCNAGWRRHHSFGDVNGEQYVNMAALTGPDGKCGISGNASNKLLTGIMAITDACEHPEVLARWIDTLYSKEWSIQMNAGPYGVTIEETEDGKYRVLDEVVGYGDMSYADYRTQVQWRQMPYIHSSEYYAEGEIPLGNLDKMAMDQVYIDQGSIIHRIPDVKLAAELGEEASRLKTDIDKYAEETICGWISGQGDVDAEWDEYISTMKQFGHDRYIEIYQQAYDNIK